MYGHRKFKWGWRPVSIEWFMEDQAFLRSYDLAPHPPTPPVSKLSHLSVFIYFEQVGKKWKNIKKIVTKLSEIMVGYPVSKIRIKLVSDPDHESKNQCCGSGMFIPDPDFYLSRNPNLGSQIQKQQQKRESEKKCCRTFFVATNITKLKIILFLNWWSKKFGPIYEELWNFLPQEIVIRLSKIWVWDPG